MSAPLSRRDFVRSVAGLGAIAMLSGCESPAQSTPTAKVRRIGYLTSNSISSSQRHIDVLQQELNLVAARQLGLTIPESVLRQATEVLQ